MENNLWGILFAVVCTGLLASPIILFIIGTFVVTGRTVKKMQKGQAEFISRLRREGVNAPAILHSAQVSSRTVRYMNGPRLKDVTLDVEVRPEGQAPFRVTTQLNNMHINQASELAHVASQTDGNRKIWVVYNPANPSEMMFDYFDVDREEVLKERKPYTWLNEFEKRQPLIQSIHKTGTEMLATILEIKDLGDRVASESATPMWFRFRVQPSSGAPFEAETEAFVTDDSKRIYLVGSKVYVKHDPQKPDLVVIVRPA